MALDMRTTNGSSQFPLHTIFTPKTFLLTWYHYGFPQSSPLEFVHMQLCFWVHFYFLEDKTRWNGRGEHIGSRKQSFFFLSVVAASMYCMIIMGMPKGNGKVLTGAVSVVTFLPTGQTLSLFNPPPTVLQLEHYGWTFKNFEIEHRQNWGLSPMQCSRRILIQEILNFPEIFWFQPGLRVGAKKRGRLQCFDINQLEKYLLRGCNVVLWCVWGVRNNV